MVLFAENYPKYENIATLNVNGGTMGGELKVSVERTRRDRRRENNESLLPPGKKKEKGQ